MTLSKTSSSPNRIFGSIRSQLVLGFGLILILALVIAIIGYQSLQSLRTSVQTTLEEASQIRELSLEIENEFLLARQDESSFLATWRSLGFEAAQAEYVSTNELHLEQARSKFHEFEKIVQNSGDPELMDTLNDSVNLIPLLDTYESAFQAVVTAIEQRSRPDGQENTMFATLNQLEAMVSPLPDPELLQLVFQIRADEQAYLNTGQRQYYDNLRLLILEFTDLVKNSSQANLPDEAAAIPASVSDPQEETVPLSAPEEIVEIPISEILELIGIYQANLTELVTIEGSIDVNTTVFREVTVEINELTDHILQEGEAGFTRARDQLQSVSDQNRLALVVVSIIALGLGSLAAFALVRGIIGPLNSLRDSAQKLGEGDLTQTVRIAGGSEFVSLAETFNTMSAQLRDLVGSLEQRVADRTRALATSTEVSRRLSTILDRDALVKEVVEQLVTAFGYYYAHIYLFEEDENKLVMKGGTGEAGQVLLSRGHTIQKGRGLVGRAAESNAVVLVGDTLNEEGWLPNELLPETRSEVAVPIAIGDNVLGVFDVQHDVIDGITEEDAELLQSIANQIAVALQNIESAETVAKRATELETVAAISTATATIQDTFEMLETMVHLTQRGFGLYHAHVFRYQEEKEELQIVACGYQEGDEQEGTHGTAVIPLEQEQSLVARCGRTRQPVIVNDVRNEPGWLPNPQLPNTRSELAVPMIVGDQLLGVLDVQSERLNAFTEEDANIQSTLASQVATALQNARSFTLAQKQAKREATLNIISQKIQSATSVEAVLQIAARELGHALDAPMTVAQLNIKDKNNLE